MKDEILRNIDNPKQLEKLYRENKSTFKREFNLLYPKIGDTKVADFWNLRLNYESSEISWGSSNELAFLVVASLLAGIIAKFPDFFDINTEFFYARNIGFIIIPILTTYFVWKNNLNQRKFYYFLASP